ncbi:MAG: apolipoprotein N-acyltransferase [Firmicutes bacterium]|nr:apolipoprotein N-acyltransferase [Bacillota bacterium]
MDSLKSNILKNYILATASGLLLAIPFVYPSTGVLAWFALVPLFFAIRGGGLKDSLILGAVFGAVFFSTSLYWIQIFGYIAWISLSLVLSVWMVLFALGARAVMEKFTSTAQLVLIPALWATCELGRSVGPWGFAWGYIGSTVDNIYILKIASYFGELGVGFLIVLVNILLFYIVAGGMEDEKRRTIAVGLVLLVLLLLVPVIDMLKDDPVKKTASQKIKVAIIQPNIAQNLKADLSNNDEIKAIYFRMTKKAVKSKPDLIVWPESVFASMINGEQEYLSKITDLTSSTKTELIFGGISMDAQGKTYNNAIYVDRQGKYRSYQKIHLVPFGEYVPFRPLVERINSLARFVEDRTPGKTYWVFNMAKDGYLLGRFSTVICFESSDSRLVGRMVQNGARMIVVITNDGWFGKTAALEQHFRITRMRAAEYGVPVIQAANTGVSGVIESSGRVSIRTHKNKQAILIHQVDFSKRPSFYSRFGHLVTCLSPAVLLAGILGRLLNIRPGQVWFFL